MIEDYRQDYNRFRPHRAHGMMTPAAFADGWRTAHEATPLSAELRRRYASAPLNAGDSLTLQKPTSHQLSQQVDLVLVLWTRVSGILRRVRGGIDAQ